MMEISFPVCFKTSRSSFSILAASESLARVTLRSTLNLNGVLVGTSHMNVASIHVHRQLSARANEQRFGKICLLANVNYLVNYVRDQRGICPAVRNWSRACFAMTRCWRR